MKENNILYLTKITLKDKDFYNQVFTNEGLMTFITEPLTLESSMKSFTKTMSTMSLTPPKLMLYVINSKNDKGKLGVIGVRWNQEQRKDAEIGIVVLKKYQRQGVGHLAKSLLIEQAFEYLGIEKIVAICDQENIAANKANEKLGFHCVNKFRENNQSKKRWELRK